MINIRKAVKEDVPMVLPMVRRICQQHRELDKARYDYVGDPGKGYENWLLERPGDPRSVFLVAEYAEDDVTELAGYLVGTVEHELAIYRLNEYGFVHDLWVESEARGEGVGKGLITGAIEAFAKMGVEQVRLTTAADNEVARGMFMSCGFAPSSVEMLCVIPANAPGQKLQNQV